ncbi:putative polyprotein [Senna tora]|uniref:Putative polyprotein n=1 Tax=Senna tora TaxID=362788 RepID=A0A834SRB8_9FABA|nr:putative polyprotein [Senna tora]
MIDIVELSRTRLGTNQSWECDSINVKRQKVGESGITSLEFFPASGDTNAEPQPMVISANINGYLVKHTLVDQGSSVDVLYYDAFSKIEGRYTDLQPTS